MRPTDQIGDPCWSDIIERDKRIAKLEEALRFLIIAAEVEWGTRLPAEVFAKREALVDELKHVDEWIEKNSG